jgi:hypothetical protein
MTVGLLLKGGWRVILGYIPISHGVIRRIRDRRHRPLEVGGLGMGEDTLRAITAGREVPTGY